MNPIRRALVATVAVMAGATGLLSATTGATGAQPLSQGLQAASAPAATSFANGENPVILVHGLFGASWNWNSFKSDLVAAGYSSDQVTAISYDTLLTSNVKTAERIAGIVDDVLARTGADKVDIVGHSMGSLNSRWCVKHDGCQGKVDDWVSLGGPNNGTTSAYLCYLVTCMEMQPGSKFLTRLNTGPSLPDDVDGTVIWSPNDGVVMPASSSVLPGVESIEAPWTDHIGLLTDDRVSALVLEALTD